jgi:hypothetical protein
VNLRMRFESTVNACNEALMADHGEKKRRENQNGGDVKHIERAGGGEGGRRPLAHATTRA